MSKSYVSLEQKICVVTGKLYETDSLLMDRRMEESMERHTTTGYGISKEAQEQIDKGFIALVGIDPDKSTPPYTPQSVYRTGEIAYLKVEVAKSMFNIDTIDKPLAFVEPEVMTYLAIQAENAK